MDSTVTTIIDESAPPAKKPRLTDDPTAAPRPQNGDKTTHHTREEDVGISQYISPHPGIFAILKQRYSDFIVHELALDGSMVQLTSFDLPPDLPAPASVNLEDFFASSDIDKLRSLSGKSDEQEEVIIPLSEDVSKEGRKSMHTAIREHFPTLESSTEDSEKGGKKIIVQRGATARKDQSGRSKWSKWPQGRGDHCQFVLYKENKDTMEAISLISHILRVKSSIFHYAGTKDRRAVTSQLVTAFRVSAEKLTTLNKSGKNLNVGNFRYVPDQLRLGDLTGNRFSLVLRKVSCEDGVLEAAFASLRDVGFVNYFGMQRFGTSVVPTHHIGRCLIHSDWEGAIALILKPRHGDSEEVNAAREHYHSTKDAAGALKSMPRWKSIERQLLQGLESHGEKKNFLGALNFIPRNTRLIYVHSWQSYIWNKIVSWRLQTHGLTPIPGDLVYREAATSSHNSKSDVDVITEETLSKYTVHDVLLPLPGFDVRWPENEAKEEMMRLLSLDGVSVDQLQHRVKDFSLSGSYRNIVAKPSDVTWEVMCYDDTTEPLFQTDMDKMNSKPPPSFVAGGGEHKALKVEFSLPSSTYATMALREVLKMDTSAAFQTTLN
ncbi:pseudouridylate synthase 7 homolog [Halichondria panicea]|uniref:pseudouridylate synthase 7 homolog n=1 Tax=Halichondria panicea TaxID=6063 RepID=UPI00312B311B